MDREDALMHAGRMRLRPILMTTFALIAGMLPVAIGAGRGRRVLPPDGRRHHRRHDHLDHADAAGGAVLLRQHRDRPRPLIAKFHRRAERYPLPAFAMTFVEAILTLVFVRLVFRLIAKGVQLVKRGGRKSIAGAAPGQSDPDIAGRKAGAMKPGPANSGL